MARLTQSFANRFAKQGHRSKGSQDAKRRLARRLLVESLESRHLLATVGISNYPGSSPSEAGEVPGQFRLLRSSDASNTYVILRLDAAGNDTAIYSPNYSQTDYTVWVTPTGNMNDATQKFPDSNGDFSVHFLPSSQTETKYVLLKPRDDSTNENSESVSLTVMSGSYTISGGSATQYIADNDLDTVSVSGGGSISENGGSTTFTISRGVAGPNPLTVYYTLPGGAGKATPGSDYSISNVAQAVIPANAPSVSVTVTAIEDSVYEPNGETVTLALSANSGYMLGSPTSASATISDNDPAPVISFPGVPFSSSESGDITVTVALDRPANAPLTIYYQTGEYYGSQFVPAEQGTDFVGQSGSIVFAPGQTQKSIVIDVIDDSIDEPTEEFWVYFSGQTFGTFAGGDQTAEAKIEDNDGPTVIVSDATIDEGGILSFAVSLSAPSPQSITVSAQTKEIRDGSNQLLPGSAQSGLDFTAMTQFITFPANNNSPITVQVQTLSDTIAEGSESLWLEVGDVITGPGRYTRGTGTITNVNNAPDAEDDEYMVDEDGSLSVPAPGVLGNDTDESSLTATLVSGPSHGTLTFNSDGSFTYTPEADYYGSDSFSYRASDGSQQSSPATVSIEVTPRNRIELNGLANAHETEDRDGKFEVKRTIGPEIPSGGLVVRFEIVPTDKGASYDEDYSLYYMDDNNTKVTIAIVNNIGEVVLPAAPAGSPSTREIFVDAVDDGEVEGVEKVTLKLLGPSSGGDYKLATTDPEDVSIDEKTRKEQDPSNCQCACQCTTTVQANNQTGSVTVKDKDSGLINQSVTNPHPVISFETLFEDRSRTAEWIEAQLTFNGVVHDPVRYDPSTLPANFDPSETFRIALQADAQVPTGRYAWQVTIREHFATGPDTVRTYDGFQSVVNRATSENGNRWAIEAVERIKVQPDGVLRIFGNGATDWFPADGNGGFERSEGDLSYSSLTYIAWANHYVFVDKYGTESRFNGATGMLMHHQDRNGNRIQYLYTDGDSDGVQDEIDEIIDPVGRVTKYNYVSGRLQSINANGHVSTFNYTGDKLTSITGVDPDGAGPQLAPVTEFSYDATTGRLTSMRKYATATSPASETVIQYREDGTVESILRPGNTVAETYQAENSIGVVPAGQESSSLTAPVPLYSWEQIRAAAHDGVRAIYLRHDRYGNPLVLEDADGNVTTYKRDSEGRIIEVTSPAVPEGPGGSLISYVTSFEYDSVGNVSKVTHPDGTFEEWEYDSEFSQITKYTDRRGKITIYELDVNGNVETVRQVVGLVDGDGNSESNDVVTSFEYTLPTLSAGVTDPPAGLISAVVDANGNRTEYEYDVNGNLRFERFAVGTSDEAYVEYTYDLTNRDRLTGFYDELRRHTQYVYDNADRVIETHLPDAYTSANRDDFRAAPVWLTEYNRFDRVTRSELSTTDPRAQGLFTAYQYTPRGNLDKDIRPDHDSDGNFTVTDYDYLPNGQLQYAFDPLGNKTEYHYNAVGQQDWVKQPDPDGTGTNYTSPQTSYTYDSLGRITSETDPNGNTTTYKYENFGRRVIVTSPEFDINEYPFRRVTTTEYDAAGNIVRQREGIHRAWDMVEIDRIETRYEYDDLNRLWKVIQANPTTGFASIADAQCPVTTYRYDAVGNRRLTIDPMHSQSALAQSSAPLTTAELTSIALQEANPVESIYDHRNRLVEIRDRDADGDRTTTPLDMPVTLYVYNDDGTVASVTDAAGRVTQYLYDGQGRLWKEIAPDPDDSGPELSPVTERLYDDAGRLWKVIDPRLQETVYSYDTLGNQISVVQPDQDGQAPFDYPTTLYEYDAAGRLTKLTDPSLNETTWLYDNLGRVQRETNELSAYREFEYDNNGNLVKRTDRLGRWIEYQYDSFNRLLLEAWFSSSGVLQEEILTSYDGNSVSYSDSSATILVGRDALGRTGRQHVSLAGFDSVQLNFSYDLNGNRTQDYAVLFGQDTVSDYKNTYVYDQLDRLTQVKQDRYWAGAFQNQVAPKQVNFSYYADSQLQEVTRYQSLNGTQIVSETAYSYDGLGRLAALEHLQGATSFASYGYSYDVASRITSIDFGTHVTNYGHDNTNQLTSADNSSLPDEAYEYDENGNRAMAGYVVGANNQLTNDGTYGYTYDAEGNRLTRTLNDTSGGLRVTEYSWDHRNRLTKVTEKLSGVVTSTVEYGYDALNRLVRRTEDADGPGSAVPTNQFFVYDGNQVVLQFDGDSVDDLSHRYLWGIGVDQLLADEQISALPAAGTVKWTYGDHLGTVRDIAEYDSGTGVTSVVNHREYDSFGNLLSESNAAHDVIFGFTGRYFDEATGLQNNLNRWYDSTTGQWLSEDPIGFSADDRNLRRYVGNNSTGSLDPTGLVWNFPGLPDADGNYGVPPPVPNSNGSQTSIGTLGSFVQEQNRLRDNTPARKVVFEYSDCVSGVTFKFYEDGSRSTILPAGANPQLPEDWHFRRNDFNRVPKTESDAIRDGWIKLPDWMNKYHRLGRGNEGNKKYIPPPNGNVDLGMEAVYDKHGNLVTDNLNGGTYNYIAPAYPDQNYVVIMMRGAGHFVVDMAPYLLFGNNPTPDHIWLKRLESRACAQYKIIGSGKRP